MLDPLRGSIIICYTNRPHYYIHTIISAATVRPSHGYPPPLAVLAVSPSPPSSCTGPEGRQYRIVTLPAIVKTNTSTHAATMLQQEHKTSHVTPIPSLQLRIHHRNPVYFASYGYRDVEQSLPPTEETVLPVCSMTKAVTSAAIGILVEEKKARWDMLVKDALPSFDINDEILQHHMTLSDLLCHRSGMA
nr:hypothetical protein L204_03619 [Cryptococcus depauperatus CBS 7855]